jgi:hypothetical protein
LALHVWPVHGNYEEQDRCHDNGCSAGPNAGSDGAFVPFDADHQVLTDHPDDLGETVMGE